MLDTLKQVQDWISTSGTSNHHPQEHGNCKTTQDFYSVKIDYDQKLTIELQDFLKNKHMDLAWVQMMIQSSRIFFIFQMKSHISATLLRMLNAHLLFRCQGRVILG